MSGQTVAQTAAIDTPPDVKRVLVIDDDPTILELIRHALGRLARYEVVTAINGAAGLQSYFSAAPDCVIVDIGMPVMDGFQFVRAIRGHSVSANTPIIVLSALTDDDNQTTGALSGVDEFVAKPFKVSVLCAALERALQISPEERARRIEGLAEGSGGK
jgi:two-component system alkaline phosphatase synthesis response regulator PhoP